MTTHLQSGLWCRILPLRLLIVATTLAISVPALAADITFFAYSDCHYGAEPAGKPVVRRRPQVQWINDLPGTAWPKSIGGEVAEPLGVIMTGDLIDHGADPHKHPHEWADYIAEFGVNGEGRVKFPVYEGLGNHDWNPDRITFKHVKKRNQERLKLGHIDHVSGNGYHYSWDWDGIHFVNLNIFPGNEWFGEADTYNGGAHHPEQARDFLKKDLEANVGNSGRPVIITFHFRPIDENWWTYSAMDKFHRIIQDYNVVLLMVGHQGGGLNNSWRGIDWASSNGTLEAFRITPDNAMVAAATKDGEWGETMKKNIFLSYKGSGLPAVINNGDWMTNITQHTATLSGKILYESAPETKVTMYWGEKDAGSEPANWQFSKEIGVQTPGEPFQVDIDGLKPWTQYYYRCKASSREGEAWAAASIPFVTPGVLPEAWATTFIGYEQRPWGGANIEDGTIELRGSGRDIGERGQRIDNFQYAYTPADGDVIVQARLTGMEGRTRDPKAGVMLRETLEMGSPSVALLSSKDGVRLFIREKADGPTLVSGSVKSDAPCWLKLVRNGDTFTGYSSEDGRQWTPVGKAGVVKMKSQTTAGLAVTAGNRDGSRHQTATFEEVQIR